MGVKRIFSLLLALVLLISTANVAFAASDKSDITGHWAEKEMKEWIEEGYISGDGTGNYNPNVSIKRAEFATLISNIIKPTDAVEVDFIDVKESDWFYDAISESVAIGYMVGDGESKTFRPNAPITRQEIAVAIQKLMDYEKVENAGMFDAYKDSDDIAAWAVDAFAAAVDRGYFIGNNGKLRPTDEITRAETIIVLDRLMGVIISEDGVVDEDIEGNITITGKGVVLKGITVNGDVYLAEGIGEGNVFLDNVKIKGSLFVKGGGFDKIVLINTKVHGKLRDFVGLEIEIDEEGLAAANPKAKTSSSNSNNSNNNNSNNGTDTTDAGLITSFEDGIPSFVGAGDEGNVTMTVVEDGATHGDKALKAVYHHTAAYPSVKLSAEVDTPWDLTNKALSFDVTNPTDSAITFYLRVDDEVDSDGSADCTTSVINVAPGQSSTFYLGFSTEAVLDLGMHTYPPNDAGTALAYGWGDAVSDMTANNIVQFQMWMMGLTADQTLIFDDIRIISDPNVDMSYLNGIVDEYGQYTQVDWDGKTETDQDLLDDAAEEALIRDTMTSPLGPVSQYGGWMGENLGGTGVFRTEKYNGAWTLVDPEGYPFFATGVTCVRFGDAATWIEGREYMFEGLELPTDQANPTSHFAYAGQVAKAPLGLTEGWIYNHYTANLERKYGVDYKNVWGALTVERMKDWGFTTIGNWSDPELFFGKGDTNEIPYAANAWINGDHARLSSGNDFWGPISDPFDPEFVVSTNTSIDAVASYGVADDEWCMGIYVDNEIAWGNPGTDASKYAVITSAFTQDATSADVFAKKAFIAKLKEIYSDDISGLNASWGTEIDSWATLEAPYTIETLSTGVTNDLSVLLALLGDEYFRIVDEVLEVKLPNTLNLGARFAEWGTSIELQEAAAKYVDVVSYNVYYEDINQSWIYTDQIDMPMIVGEFHFGATDRGMFKPGLVAAADQEGRGDMYQDYISSVANSTNFVGAHWFQYTDQPITGRAWDGENNNIGFVDVTDRPYEHMVSAAREIHGQVYDIRYGTVRVSEVTLDLETLALDAETTSGQLTATVSPVDAANKEVKWLTSNKNIAEVSANGMVTAISNGTVTITGYSVAYPSIKATCEVTVEGIVSEPIEYQTISFEESEDLSTVEAYKEAVLEYVTEGVTDGARAMKISNTDVGSYSGVGLVPTAAFDLGDRPTITFDITNPESVGTQARVNLTDVNAVQWTFYFNLQAGESRTVSINDLETLAANWGDPDGFFGSTVAIDSSQISKIEFYFGDDVADIGMTYIIDNLKISKGKPVIEIPKLEISFEESEDLSYIEVYKDGVQEYVADGVTDGARAMKVSTTNVGSYSGVSVAPATALNLGDTPSITFDITNTDTVYTQARVNVTDINSVTWTYYFGLEIDESRSVAISDFETLTADWGSPDGFFGSDTAIDYSQISMIDFYLGDDVVDNGVEYIIDNLVITSLPVLVEPSMLEISFEESEDISYIEAYKDGVQEYVTEGVTDGARAMKVSTTNVGSYSGVSVAPATALNLGDTPSITFDITNTDTVYTQARVNVTDINSVTWTFYFGLEIDESRSVAITDFETLAADWGSPDGFFGSDTAIDVSQISKVDFYLGDDVADNGVEYIIDNLVISE